MKPSQKKIDLHCHSTYSDGTSDPEEVVLRAKKCGITHLALSDHDCISGIPQAQETAIPLGLEIIPAIEINTEQGKQSIHILGYFIDLKNKSFQKKLQDHCDIRKARAEEMIEKLQGLGIDIHIDDFKDRKQKSALGRPHIADRLRELGIVSSRKEAFNEYLAEGKKAHVFSEKGPTPRDAIDMILEAKGVAVLAHPGFGIQTPMIENLKSWGLQGLEIYYPSHNPQQIANFLKLADRLDLLVTGGSDDHGPGSGHEALGKIHLPEEAFNKLKEKAF